MIEEGGTVWTLSDRGNSGLIRRTSLAMAQETGLLSHLAGLDIRRRSQDGRGLILDFRVGRVLVGAAVLPACLAERDVAADVTIVGLSLDAVGPPLTVNGQAHPRPSLLVSHRGAYDCVWLDPGGPAVRRTANLVFPGDNADRGWPVSRGLSLVVPVAAEALESLRRLVAAALEVAAARPDRFAAPDIVAQFEADLYGAVDHAFLDAVTPRSSERIGVYAARLRDLLRADFACRLRSSDVAAELGVSQRTLNAVCNALFGMSPHQYLKLRRLYRVKECILAAGDQVLVKQCALSFGFWHLGQFARDYWLAFGETPAQTLRRTRGR